MASPPGRRQRRFLDETGLRYLEKRFGIADVQAAVRRALREA